MTPSRLRQVIEPIERLVCHGVGLQVTPDVLRWVQFRSIGRQEYCLPILFPNDMAMNKARPMGHEPIPYQEDGTLAMPAEMLEEGKNPRRRDIGLGMKTKEQSDAVSFGQDDQGRNRGNFPIGVGPVVKERCLARWSPCPPHQRHHQKPAFIEKNEGGAYPSGVFFTFGQTVLIQDRMASSSRSTARRCGFWGLHPRECKIRPR